MTDFFRNVLDLATKSSYRVVVVFVFVGDDGDEGIGGGGGGDSLLEVGGVVLFLSSS